VPLADATASVESSAQEVDAFFDGKAGNESLSWFYQQRAEATTTELFLSDLSVRKKSLLFSSFSLL